MGSVTVIEHRGWDVLRLTSEALEVDVVPGKGGDILAVRWRPLNLNVLWTTPWGLRQRGAVPTAASSHPNAIEHYPGGWQTVFPNGGNAVTEHGVEWGFHGEAWVSPWDHDVLQEGSEGAVIELRTRLVRAPFELVRRIRVFGDRVDVAETVTNVGSVPVEAMWSHHPAFGAPFLSGACTIETGAASFVADDVADTPSGDIAPGVRSAWPLVAGKDGGTVDLRLMPSEGAGIDRFGYLTDFERGEVVITNPELALSARLGWDHEVFPHAWYWLEAGGTSTFPWYNAAYVLGIEPATSYPGQGLAAVREKTGTQVPFEPGAQRTGTITLCLQDG